MYRSFLNDEYMRACRRGDSPAYLIDLDNEMWAWDEMMYTKDLEDGYNKGLNTSNKDDAFSLTGLGDE